MKESNPFIMVAILMPDKIVQAPRVKTIHTCRCVNGGIGREFSGVDSARGQSRCFAKSNCTQANNNRQKEIEDADERSALT